VKPVKLCLTILIAAVVINFLRDGRTFHIAKVLPFASGRDTVPLYDWGGVILLCLFAWGLYRLNRTGRH
jgi:hypothetical protein